MGSNHQSHNGSGVAPLLATHGRINSSWPLLVVAALFVVGALLTWYFTWFGRELSAVDISTYLADEKPRKIQHALLQVQQKIERGDESARQWYPQVLALVNHPETELRLTTAWVMGFDNKSPEFHQALLRLLQDPEPMVRRNAALALVRFGDDSGRAELRSVFEPYPVRVETAGTLSSTLKPGASVSRGALIARLHTSDSAFDVRSPLPGQVETLVKETGATVQAGDVILTVRSDEESVWEALRGLAIIGGREEMQVVKRYLETGKADDRLKQQATLTVKAIEGRTNSR